jgi:hypothetical protein
MGRLPTRRLRGPTLLVHTVGGEPPEYLQVLFWLATVNVVRGELPQAFEAVAALPGPSPKPSRADGIARGASARSRSLRPFATKNFIVFSVR